MKETSRGEFKSAIDTCNIKHFKAIICGKDHIEAGHVTRDKTSIIRVLPLMRVECRKEYAVEMKLLRKKKRHISHIAAIMEL